MTSGHRDPEMCAGRALMASREPMVTNREDHDVGEKPRVTVLILCERPANDGTPLVLAVEQSHVTLRRSTLLACDRRGRG
jgi:hypothetical protein